MFTDIVGYTSMMHDNEQLAIQVREKHREIFEKNHEEFRGEILQYYGDGTLSIFQSAIEGVRCAVAMQQQLCEGLKVPLRIGIHLGDIVLNDNEIYGDGVNVAARIESLGMAGAILISEKVYSQIRNQTGLQTENLGFFEFKNIHEPLEVHAISNQGIKVPDRSELKGKLAEKKKSIAVLPFANLSSDPENEYFSDGISEEILNALVKVNGLQVTARTSSFAFKNQQLDVREIGRILNVKYVLEGSVRKAGNRVRITAQLINSRDGFHIFSETYDRDLQDIFAVQDEISLSIANQLRELLTETEREDKLITAITDNVEAYEQYLKGQFYFNQWGDQAARKAKPYFEKAVEIQPDFPQALCGLGGCYIFFAFGGFISWSEAYEKGMPYLKKALELDPESIESLVWLGAIQTFCEWDWKALKQTVDKLLKLNPGDARVYHPASTYFVVMGEMEKAIEMETKGLALDPVSVQLNFYLGIFNSWSLNHEKGNEYFNQVLEFVPGHRTAIEMKGVDALVRGKPDEAISLFDQISEFGYRLHKSTLLGCAHAINGNTEEVQPHLNNLLRMAEQGQPFAFQNLAILYAQLGQPDEAFNYLELALDNKVGDSMMFRHDPLLQPLKEDKRFDQLAAKIGLV